MSYNFITDPAPLGARMVVNKEKKIAEDALLASVSKKLSTAAIGQSPNAVSLKRTKESESKKEYASKTPP